MNAAPGGLVSPGCLIRVAEVGIVSLNDLYHQGFTVDTLTKGAPLMILRTINSWLRRAMAMGAMVLVASSTNGQSTLYWDINGSTSGAGNVGGFTDGTWGIDNFWSTDPNGEVATGAWVDGDNAVFSAGSDAVNHFITIDGTQNLNSLTVEDGLVFLATGTANQGTGDIVVEDGATLRIASRLRINDGGRVILRNGTLWQSNPGFAGSFLGSSTTLEVDGVGTIDRTALMDNGGPSAEPVERQISIYNTTGTTTISGTGGTPGNGGAGTLIKTGPSEFRYQGTGLPLTSFSKLVVEEGLFRLGFSQNIQDMRGFGADPLVETADAITLNGGAIATSFALSQSELHPNRGVTIGSNGGTFDAGHMVITGPLSGSGTMHVTSVNRTLRLTNANNVNTFDGNVNLTSGILDLDESLVTPSFAGLYDGRTTGAGVFEHAVTIAANKTLTVGSDGSDTTFEGDIIGPGDFVKVGSGVQTLAGGAALSSADMVVQEGTLRLTNPLLAPEVNISLATGTILDLDFDGTNAVRTLYVDDLILPTGTWGAVGSGAEHESALISGNGRLVVAIPEPTGLSLIALATGMLLLTRHPGRFLVS